MRYGWPWLIAPLFPVLVVAGQLLARNPEGAPWLFPFVNVGIVAIPSLVIAGVVTSRYLRAQRLAWPFSWREWTSGLIYGAVGATTIAAIVNTGYLAGMGAWLMSEHGAPGANLDNGGLETLPRAWGVFLDLTTLSVVAPLNEEFWKGMLVAFFFFRRGGAARCFAWGVLAGAGFNLLETFQNSLAAISPEAQASQQIGDQFWLFAGARGGTAVMHALAAGLSALGWYGLLRRRPRYLVGYPAAVCLHASWNFLVYVIAGDAMFSRQGPDSRLLDYAGIAGLVAVFALAVMALWHLSGRLRDDGPAPIYRLLCMVPRGPASEL